MVNLIKTKQHLLQSYRHHRFPLRQILLKSLPALDISLMWPPYWFWCVFCLSKEFLLESSIFILLKRSPVEIQQTSGRRHKNTPLFINSLSIQSAIILYNLNISPSTLPTQIQNILIQVVKKHRVQNVNN